ncbi:zona pellucida sperm-binding protein 4-like [Genypterus blacodes]|uniref:zona pellucida sperm-binding protein 4-like n=1 Tax=Genypterus blacodes TaxID=154954 RepID=UPI003F778105
MSYKSARIRLFSFALILVCQNSCCLSSIQRKTSDKRAELLLPTVSCSARLIRAVFGPRVSNIHVKNDSGATVPVPEAEGTCGVRKGRETNDSLSFFSRYDSCYTQMEGSRVVVPLQIQLAGEHGWYRVNISCPLIKSHSQRTHPVPTQSGKCDTQRNLRVDCGPERITRDACYELGCCFDAHDSYCYYRPNTCSLDGHFIFSVKASDTDPPLDPGSLSVKAQPQCFPVIVTTDAAVFKISITDCGAKMKVVDDEMIYEVEVEEEEEVVEEEGEEVQTETKRSPLSLRVQCQYDRSALKRAADLWSSHAVTNPPPAVAFGTIRVQMRIATDDSFTSFFTDDQLPLRLPLRKAAYVEVSIPQPSPDPTLSLRVQDCFASPASRHSVWTLLYEGCPNPLDDMGSSVPVDSQGRTTSHSQSRRFDVKTFAFLDPHTGQPSLEEMFFYCWVEICPEDVDCAQSCSIVSSEGDRPRREAQSKSSQVQLISLGPLLTQNSTQLTQNSTQLKDSPCVTQSHMFQVTVYLLSAVGVALLLVLMVTVGSSIRRCRPKAERAHYSRQSQ